jgi:pyruvate/2-oxoglutarate dehydrogenase complex dihydrolipoamide dehydrogenase (E3) component
MDYDYDFVVIGGGSAGYAAARTAHDAGMRVAVVDSADELGGLCILRGCMPSKTLIYSAEVLHLAQQATRYGLDIPRAAVDMPALQRRKQHWVADFRDYRQQQLASGRFELLRAQARFVAHDTVELQPGGRRVRARFFMVATGSRVHTPAVPGLDAAAVWTSDDVLELTAVPPSVIVLGGGVVACELAQFLRRVGSHVIQIQRSPRLLRECSAAAAAVVADAFRAEGIELLTGTRLQAVTHDAGGFQVRFEHDGGVDERRAAHLFNALGRVPNTRGLGLEQAGVQVDGGGRIVVDGSQRTTNPAVFAAGDVTGPYEIVHLAIMQGEVAARAAAGLTVTPVNYAARTSVVFTDPQVAQAGMSEDEARAAGIDCVVASYPFADHGKSLLMEAPHGFVKVIARRQDLAIIGAECVGKDGGELIHAMAVAVATGARAPDLLKVHWYHPTLSEIWSYPIEELCGV